MKATPLALANQNTVGFSSGAEVFALIKFPCSNHRLPVEADRQGNWARENRIYMKCSLCVVLFCFRTPSAY